MYNALVVGVWGRVSKYQAFDRQSWQMDEKQIPRITYGKNPESCFIWMERELSAHVSECMKK